MGRFTVLAGGVGAARFLAGLLDAVDPGDVTAVVNVGDDFVLHGLSISPDLDTVVYTLAGAINPETGWGLAGESWQAMTLLETLGGESWFRLGDRDLATHLFRTQRLQNGATLSEVAADLARAWKVGLRILPVTDGRLQTKLTLLDEGTEIAFQDYFVRLHHDVAVSAVRFDGANSTTPAPGVLDAIDRAERVIIAPSNPIVSIGPVLAVPTVRAAVEGRRHDAVAISPIVAGTTVKGPADRLMTELGHEASVVGVARLYAPLAGTLVVDAADAHLADAVEAEGMRCVVTDTIMRDPGVARSLAETAITC